MSSQATNIGVLAVILGTGTLLWLSNSIAQRLLPTHRSDGLLRRLGFAIINRAILTTIILGAFGALIFVAAR